MIPLRVYVLGVGLGAALGMVAGEFVRRWDAWQRARAIRRAPRPSLIPTEWQTSRPRRRAFARGFAREMARRGGR